MLKLYRSTDLNILADRWLEERHKNLPKNPLQPARFIVQNYGMGRWFSLYKARKEGIAANLEIEFPAERIWSLFRLLYPDIPKTLPSDKEPMIFSIMDILEEGKGIAALQPLYEYIDDDASGLKAFRSWKLSNRIADLFDQYLIYRPQMLLSWQAHQTLTDDDSERWQAALWRSLKKRWTQEKYSFFGKHRAELHRDLLQAIDEKHFSKGQLPAKLTIFAVSSLPPVFLKTFIRLSICTDVQFYMLDTDRNRGDTHAMMESLGKESAVFLDLFYRFVEENEDVKSGFSKQFLKASLLQSTTVLNTFQKNILQGVTGPKPAEAALDSSLQIHSCHSLLREVEVLYDQLLALFDENNLLKPEDVVIMSPDIETYAPLIDAVFGTAEESLPEIPYRINDRSFQKSRTVKAFLKVLEISQSRFKVTDVLDILNLPPIMHKLQITHEDVSRIEKWVDENNIRWGIDGPFKAEYGLPEDAHFTWQAGLSRMLLGYAMQQQGRNLYQGNLPYNRIEGSDSMDLLGKLDELLQKLFLIHDEAAGIRSVENWIHIFKKVIRDFLPETDEEAFEIINIRKMLEKMAEVISLAHFERAVPCSVILSHITAKLEQQQRRGSYMGHGVTFCAMAPMRGIPFKVVGLLGMDEGAYPKQKPTVEFDLLRRYPEPGDPDQAKEDRQLFLETVLAARETLYVSYTGQSNRQDTTIPPSVLISELVYSLQDELEITAEKLITKHRLQPFSPAYFRPDSEELFSYSKVQLLIAQKLVDDNFYGGDTPQALFKKLDEPEEEYANVTLQQLIAFFQHPAKYVLRRRLGIYLPEKDIADEDREVFQLKGLDRYYVKDELFGELLEGRPLDGMKAVLEAKDLLPAGPFGDWAFTEQAEAATHFYSSIRQKMKEPLEPLEMNKVVETEGPSFRLTGRLTHIYSDGLLLHRFGSMRAKDRIAWWLKHLAWSVKRGQNSCSRFYTYDSKKASISMEEMSLGRPAEDILRNLLNLFWHGLQQPFLFFPESSYAFTHALVVKEASMEKALGRANIKWKGNKYTFIQEQEDIYNKMMFKNYNLLDSNDFKTLSKQFWTPYFESIIGL